MVSKQGLEMECARLQERHREHPEGRVFAPLADVLRKLGRLDEAVEVCERGLQLHPGYSSAHVILGKIHLERHEPDAAVGDFQRVLEIDDENLLALRHLAGLHEKDGALAQALELWRRVRRIEPESDEVENRIEELERRLDPSSAAETRDAGDEGPTPETADGAEAEPVPDTADGTEAEPLPESASAVEEIPEATVSRDDPAVTEEERREGEDASRASTTNGASSAEIATITLAQIYYEQGFLAKALEVFEQIHSRNPHLAGLEERIESIREELRTQTAPRPHRPSEVDLDDLAPAREEPIARRSSDGSPQERRESTGDDIAVETEHEEPMTRRMTAESEQERFENFRRWLDGISADEKRDSQ